ncbi:hypothetical protein HYX19_01315 [Candidatus Woesearchaeota archaeon]|nr:hypothetical protein [Candidatus Woesearchaeota archaeon]
MDLLQLREKEVFEILKKISKYRFVVIGGYAVNAYTLARFSVDCDIVVGDDVESRRIGKVLKENLFTITNAHERVPYHEKFVRYEKEVKEDFKVSIDMFISTVFDRQTNVSFAAEWIFENSKFIFLKGKTITEKLRLRVINPEALMVMKFVSCRTTDIRDIFMLISGVDNSGWIRENVSQRCDFKDRFSIVKNKIISSQFKNNLRGVYGYIDEKLFEKYKKAVLGLGQFRDYRKITL